MEEDLKPKAILFDLDDTLLDSKTAEYNAIISFKKEFSKFNKIDEKDFAEIWHKITMDVYQMYESGKIQFSTLKTERMKNLFLEFKTEISNEEAREYYNTYREKYKKNWILFNDAIEVLKKLKSSYKLAIVSNGDSKQQREKIEKTGLEKYFSVIVISGEVSFTKPDKQIFEIACKNLDVKPKECIMIGDKYKTDILGAINAGIKAIWINRKDENIEYEYQIKELKGVLNICK